MKRVISSLFTLFGLLATALLIGGGSAQANIPPSNCANQAGLVNIVVCEIDVDDNSVLNGNDVKIEILNYVASGNELNVLVSHLDALNIDAKDLIDVGDVVIQDLVDFDPDVNVIIISPCGCH